MSQAKLKEINYFEQLGWDVSWIILIQNIKIIFQA